MRKGFLAATVAALASGGLAPAQVPYQRSFSGGFGPPVATMPTAPAVVNQPVYYQAPLSSAQPAPSALPPSVKPTPTPAPAVRSCGSPSGSADKYLFVSTREFTDE